MSSPPIYPLHNFLFFFQVSRLRLPSEIISFALCHFVHCFSFTILPCFAMVAKKQRLEFFLSCSAMYACDWVTLILCLCNRLDQISIIIIINIIIHDSSGPQVPTEQHHIHFKTVNLLLLLKVVRYRRRLSQKGPGFLFSFIFFRDYGQYYDFVCSFFLSLILFGCTVHQRNVTVCRTNGSGCGGQSSVNVSSSGGIRVRHEP
jgi:hypothetical protein